MRHAPKRLHFPVAAFLLLSFSLGLSGCGRSTSPTSVAPSTRLQPGVQTQFVYGSQGFPVVAGEAIVKLNDGEDLEHFATGHDLQVVATLSFDGENYVRVRSTVAPNSAVLDQALAPHVEWAGPNALIQAPRADGNPMSEDDGGPMEEASDYVNQYAVSLLDMANAHAMATGAGVRIAVLDTGLDPLHVVFSTTGPQVVIRGFSHWGDFPMPWVTEEATGLDTDEDTFEDEAYGHGTHVSGIIRLAAPGAVVIAIPVLDSDGWGTLWGACEGIYEAVDREARVINMSFGIPCSYPILEDAVKYANNREIVMVASAGNSGTNEEQWPAAYDEVISVTSTNNHDEIADFATRNDRVDLSAPGVDIVSAIPAPAGLGEYANTSGSSSATPWVSAAAALILQLEPRRTASEVMTFLQQGSVSIADINPGLEGQIGAGRVSLSRPLEMLDGGLIGGGPLSRQVSAR